MVGFEPGTVAVDDWLVDVGVQVLHLRCESNVRLGDEVELLLRLVLSVGVQLC
jgi:hypothetical protein